MEKLIERTWTVTDEAGNVGTCMQTITILPLDLDSLVFPGPYEGECAGSSHPSVTGWPTVDGLPVMDNLCNILVAWEDMVLPDCGGGTKIMRRWTVIDWCASQMEESFQAIKLADHEGPELTCPPDQTVSTSLLSCSADVDLVAPTGYDACGTPFDLSPSTSQGTIIDIGGGQFRVGDLPLGESIITWTAIDQCGNASTCSYTIEVVDDVPPALVCDGHTVVSLTSDLENGLTKVPAEIFNAGSYDNCTPITYDVRRMDSCIDFDWTTNGAGIDNIPDGSVTDADRGTIYKPMAPFACCDVGQGPIMVELRATDASGNSISCMVEVTVDDKLSPSISAPPDIYVSCEYPFIAESTGGAYVPLEDDPLSDEFGLVLDAFDYTLDHRQPIIINDPANDQLDQPHNWGLDGWADDNCNVDLTVRVDIWDDCSGDALPGWAPHPNATRAIKRTFRAIDPSGNLQTDEQWIWVVEFDPFYISDQNCNNEDPNDGVIWPCDQTFNMCPDSIPVVYPVVFDGACSIIGTTFEDDVYLFADGACRKIVRTWSIIDWCQYDSETGAGRWTYEQIIKIMDSDGAEVTDCPSTPQTFCVSDSNVSLPATNQVFLGENNPGASSCSAHLRLTHSIHEMCSDQVTYDVKVLYA